MIRTQKQWNELYMERGSGSVNALDVLNDWQEERNELLRLLLYALNNSSETAMLLKQSIKKFSDLPEV